MLDSAALLERRTPDSRTAMVSDATDALENRQSRGLMPDNLRTDAIRTLRKTLRLGCPL